MAQKSDEVRTSKEFIPLSSNASLNLGMNVTF